MRPWDLREQDAASAKSSMCFRTALRTLRQLPDWRLSRRLQQLLEFAFVGLVDLLWTFAWGPNGVSGGFGVPGLAMRRRYRWCGLVAQLRTAAAFTRAHFSVSSLGGWSAGWVFCGVRFGSRPIAARETLTNNRQQSAERDPGVHPGAIGVQVGGVVEQTRIIGKRTRQRR